MFTIKTLNKIAAVGLDRFDKAKFTIDDAAENPDAIVVRSAQMLDYTFNSDLLCVARAGAGYNNIPVELCAEKGIVVFNTPGANANGVKELVICALLLASRDIIGSIDWVRSIADKNNEVAALVEKGKSNFAGPEIMGKTLGLQGVGAVGFQVAKAAHALGMCVFGFDPYLPDDIKATMTDVLSFVETVDELYSVSDYLSLHLPYNTETKGIINSTAIAKMKDGIRIINSARGEIVNDDDMFAALESKKIARYVTDFPNGKTADAKGVVAIPHLAASTPESEDNCAVMAADQISEYLLNGNIINSVNLPNITLEKSGGLRVVVISKGDVLQPLLTALSAAGISVLASASKTRGEYAAAILDLNTTDSSVQNVLSSVAGVVRVRTAG